MADMNKQALEMWGAMKPMIDKEIAEKTRGMVQRRKAKVTTAPSLITNKIGVTEPFGDQYFVPFMTNLISAQIGDVVWVEFMYGATNSFATMFAGADEKDFTVAGDIHVLGDAEIDGKSTFVGDVEFQGNVIGIDAAFKMSATLSSAGWYRILYYGDTQLATILEFKMFIPESLGSGTDSGEVHRIKYPTTDDTYAVFSNEYSAGDSLLIDKIRRTSGGDKDGVSAWAFDIHYAGGSTTSVCVEVGISGDYDSDAVFIENLSPVLDAPSGETVSPIKNLAKRTEGDIKSFYSVTRTSGGTATVDKAYRYGNVVSMDVTVTANASTAAGSDFFEGSISGVLPLIGEIGVTYYGARTLLFAFDPNGHVVARYSSGSSNLASGTGGTFHLNFLVE